MSVTPLRDRIADLILSGEFRPGDNLDEQALALRFGVSRTPVREALHQLAPSGLIEMRPRRPTLVKRLNPAQLADAFEALGEIEALCARYSADRMSQIERMQLSEIMKRGDGIAARNDRELYRAVDSEFHNAVHEGARNASLHRLASQMRMQVAPYGASPYTLPGWSADLSVPHQQHKRIAEAITARDSGSAHRLMAEHIALSSATFQTIWSDKTMQEEAASKLRRKRRS
ncbi:MAG: hypothetical protein BGP06_04710 [Rhizobiales bacterium 65-9]|nr:GntR family transcriptional regulator [Hyphomicrobiales bacterium]OJY39444.1 MAG: hypothetical protein BGP06_04710 [Rhizobiales bacterium 65-9]